jgi:hypothetical protein
VGKRSRRPVLTKRWVRADLPPAAEPGPEPETEDKTEDKTAPEVEADPEPEPAFSASDIIDAEVEEIDGGTPLPARVIADLGEVDALLDAADG